MQTKVQAGVSTITLGGVSLVSYVLAVLAFLDGQRDEATITLAVTGTVALVTMAAGRFWQAVEKIRATKRPMQQALTGPYEIRVEGGSAKPYQDSGTSVVSTFTTPRPGAELRTIDRDEDAPDLAVQPPDPTIDDPELDDPDYEAPPTREQHSRLKG